VTDTHSPDNAEPAFNSEFLDQMIESLPPGMPQQLFDKLSEECDRLLAALKDETKSAEETTSAAHEFKGMLANFGLDHSSRIAAEIEHSQKHASMIGPDVARLEASIARGRQAIKTVLDKSA